MKKILLFLLLIPMFCFSQNQDIKTMVIHGDTLFVKNWTANDSIQLNRIIPSQVGQAGKLLGTNGTNYIWQTSGGGISQQTLNDSTAALRAALQPSGNYSTGGGTATGTNTGDNATNSQYSGLAASKQDLLVSGTNIKTVNGTTLLGSGDISISGAPTFLNLASNFSSTITTEASVTGWSFPVTTGKTYRIEVIAAYQTAATTTGGELGFFLSASAVGTIRGSAEAGIVSTAAATGLKQQISVCTTADAAGSNLISTGVTAINSPHYFNALVTFTCTTSGTFNVGWASEVAGSASQLNANSTLIYQQLN